MTEMLKGIAASDGVAVAKAYLLVQPDLSFETVTVEDTNFSLTCQTGKEKSSC